MAQTRTSWAVFMALAGFLAVSQAKAGDGLEDGRGGLMKAVADLQAHRYGKAGKRLAQIVASYPASLEAEFYLGQALYYQGRPDEAKIRFEHVRSADAGIPVTYYYLGRIAFDGGDYAGALEQLQEADQKDPDLPMAHYYLGLAYDREHRPGEALVEFHKALALQADLGLASYAMAYVLFHEFKRSREALACLKSVAGAADAGLRRKTEALRKSILRAP